MWSSFSSWNNWRAPWKGGVCTYFAAILQVAPNPLKYGMPTLFVWKNVRLFFQEGGIIWTKLRENPPNHPPPPPPLCPSPNNVGFWSLRAQTLCVCVLRYWRAGGLSRTCFKAPCPRTLIWPLICSLAVVVLFLLKVHPKRFCCRVLYCFQFIQLSCILLLYYMYACSDLVSIILHQVTVLYN